MSQKLIWKGSKGAATAKAYWNPADEEFSVRFFCNGRERRGAAYFTDAKDDAIGTAKAMLSHNDCEPALGCGCAGRK